MPKEIRLRPATLDDVTILAEMNQQLVLDEGSRNPMALEQLKERMYRWLTGDRDAVIVERRDETIGYMLFWRVADEYYPYKDSIYILLYMSSKHTLISINTISKRNCTCMTTF